MAFLGLISKKEYEKLAGELEAIKRQFLPYERWQLETAEAERFSLPDPSVYDNQANLYRRLSWVLQAVDVTATASALTPFSVARIIAGKEPKDIPNHEFEMLLAHPNPLDSRFEFLYATLALWILNGNAYWWLNRASESAVPDELWFIPPSKITPIPDDKMFLRGYMYYPGNGAEIFLEPHEIVHFRRFNPFSRFVGLSAIEAIAQVAVGDLGMSGWNTRLFAENNARLPGVLTFQQMIEQSVWDKIKNDTREAAKKRELLMLRGVGEGGVQWLQNSVSQKEMEFLEGRKANAKEIMDTLAPGLYTWLSGESTYSNAGANRAAFNELTLYPKHVMMAEKITSSILTAYPGRPLIGHFEDVRLADRQLELTEQQEYSKSHTLEEIREKYYGDPPLGDERDELLPEQVTASAGGVQPEPVPPTPSPAPPQDGTPQDMQDNAMQEEGAQDTQEAEKRAVLLDELAKFERKALKRAGKAVEFISDILPADEVQEIHDKLATCHSVTAVKAVFDAARARLKRPALQGEPNGLLALAAAINAAAQKVTA